MVFELFSKHARTLVTEAAREAAQLGSEQVDPLHLLMAIGRFPASGAARVLVELGVAPDDVVAEVETSRRRGGVSEVEAAALDELGIDIDAIVAQVERGHGPNALAGRRAPTRSHVPFADAAKRILERTLREAMALGDRRLRTEYILLALAEQPGAASGVLAGLGVTADGIRTALRRAS